MCFTLFNTDNASKNINILNKLFISYHKFFESVTGKTEMELPEVRSDVPGSGYCDIYPIIWKKYRKNGYAILFNEDEPRYNVFHHR